MKPDKKNQRTKNKMLTRREAFAVMGVSAASLPFLTLSTGLPTLVKAEGQDGKPVSSLTTRTQEGVVISAKARPRQLTFSVVGPVPLGRSVPLAAIPKESPNLTAEQSRQREATLQLLAAAGWFVAPRDCELNKKKEKGKLMLRFLFLGEENPARRIRIDVVVKDGSNAVLQHLVRDCSDQRQWAREQKGRVRSRKACTPSIVNSEILQLDNGVAERARSIELSFEDI